MRILAALFALLWLSSAQAFDIQGSGYIYRAADGDTYWVSDIQPQAYRQLFSQSRDPDHFNDRYRSVKMRLGATDTAESVHRDEARNTLRGKTISAFMGQLTKNQKVTFRCWDIGDYDRPICSIKAANIGDIGLYLIKNNFSEYVTYWGRHPFLDAEYRQAGGR